MEDRLTPPPVSQSLKVFPTHILLCSFYKAEWNSKFWPVHLINGTFNKGLLRLNIRDYTCGCSQTIMAIFFSEKKRLEIVPLNSNRNY